MLPVSELRGAIPLALGVYHWPVWQAFSVSVIGNIIPVIFILLFLESISGFMIKKWPWANKFFTWLFQRTRNKNTKSFQKWGELALAIFVAIPLPMTGAWTGALAAFVFGIPFKRALFWIFFGVIGAGVIVTLISTGTISFLKIIL